MIVLAMLVLFVVLNVVAYKRGWRPFDVLLGQRSLFDYETRKRMRKLRMIDRRLRAEGFVIRRVRTYGGRLVGAEWRRAGRDADGFAEVTFE